MNIYFHTLIFILDFMVKTKLISWEDNIRGIIGNVIE